MCYVTETVKNTERGFTNNGTSVSSRLLLKKLNIQIIELWLKGAHVALF